MDSMQRPKSHAAFERAKRLIPGGVNSPARAFGAVGGSPLFVARSLNEKEPPPEGLLVSMFEERRNSRPVLIE